MSSLPAVRPEPTLSPSITAVEAARLALARQLNVESDAVKVHAIERVEWPDGCLGMRQPEESCALTVVPGYGGIFIAGRLQFEFRTDERGEQVRLMPGAALAARQNLAHRLGIPHSDIHIYHVEAAEWADACLGIQQEGIDCAQLITPGYRVTLVAEDLVYEYHTDDAGTEVRLVTAPKLPVDPEALYTAQVTLESFLYLLSEGRFIEAELLFGGNYQPLIDVHPEIDPTDGAALLQAACTVDGFACLPLRRVVSSAQLSDASFRFSIELQALDGTVFSPSPCCDGDGQVSSEQMQSGFRVHKVDGVYLVQDLPAFIP